MQDMNTMHNEPQQTPFYNCHLSSNGKIVNFGGFALPINYGSQIKEHEQVRQDCGMFDVSHMCITDISGSDAKSFMRYLISNDINKLDKAGAGKALYSGMLNHDAGIIDDLIVYLMPFGYRMVTNASTRLKDLTWIRTIATQYSDVNILEQNHLAILAVQGPNAITKFVEAFPETSTEVTNLKPFTAIESSNLFIARTGYTGEHGLEIILPETRALELWHKLLNVNITPCGLGARDTLRLEAGMNLYGQDMDETITPLECGMDWVVDLTDHNRDFIGKTAYLNIKQQVHITKQVGLILTGKGVLRNGQKIYINNIESGVITSGTFSPTMKQSIAIARLNSTSKNESIYVDIRGNLEPVIQVKLPFVRNGKLVNSQ